MKIFLFLICLMCCSVKCFSAPSPDMTENKLSFSVLRLAAMDSISYCKEHGVGCSIAVIGPHGTPRIMSVMLSSFTYRLLQALDNATVALALRMDVFNLKNIKLESRVQLRSFIRTITRDPYFQYTQGGKPIIIHDQLLGAVGATSTAEQRFSGRKVVDFYISDLERLLKNKSYYQQRQKKLLSELPLKSNGFAMNMLLSTVPAFKACKQEELACAITIVDPYGQIIFKAAQDGVSSINVLISNARAVSAGTSGMKYHSRLTPNQKVIQQSLIAYSFMNTLPMLPLTAGSEPLYVDSHLLGGVGVSSSLKGASPLYWQRGNRLVADSVVRFLALRLKY